MSAIYKSILNEEANKMTHKRCASLSARIITLLLMIVLAILIGILCFLLWPHPNETERPLECPKIIVQNKTSLSIAFLRHREDMFLVAPGRNGIPFSVVVFNESDPDGGSSSVDLVVKQIASHEFRRDHKPLYTAAVYDNDKIVPADTEKWMWDDSVGSRFVVKVSYVGGQFMLDMYGVVGVLSVKGPEGTDKLFETLREVEKMLPDTMEPPEEDDQIDQVYY